MRVLGCGCWGAGGGAGGAAGGAAGGGAGAGGGGGGGNTKAKQKTSINNNLLTGSKYSKCCNLQHFWLFTGSCKLQCF